MFSILDFSIALVSVVIVVAFSIYSARQQDNITSDDFFLARRSMSWPLIAASLFAANVGTEQFVGMAGTAAKSGIAVGLYELSAPYALLILGWIFAPLYRHINLKTTAEYMERRFNRSCRVVFVCVLIATHVLSSLSATLYAGSVVIEVISGLNIWQALPVVILLTAVYTALGGLKAVMSTDALQSCILLTGGMIGSYTALDLVGGVRGLFDKLETLKLNDFPHIFRPLDDQDFPWLGLSMALMIGGVRCWCIDQEMAQRVLSAKDLNHARLGTAGAGLLKLLSLFITIFPGMVARLLFELCNSSDDFHASAEWCASNLDDSHHSNKAYPLLVVREFPQGLKGLMMASFIAAMMSSLASLFNSISSMIVYDIYVPLFAKSENLSSKHLIRAGRIAVMGLVAVTCLWIPVIDSANRGLFIVASEVMHHLGPSITAVFICGVFLKQVNEQGALIGLSVGSLLGALRMIIYLMHQSDCDGNLNSGRQVLNATNWILCLNFHYLSPLLFFGTASLVIITSKFYPLPCKEQTEENVVSVGLVSRSLREVTCKFGASSVHAKGGSEDLGLETVRKGGSFDISRVTFIVSVAVFVSASFVIYLLR